MTSDAFDKYVWRGREDHVLKLKKFQSPELDLSQLGEAAALASDGDNCEVRGAFSSGVDC